MGMDEGIVLGGVGETAGIEQGERPVGMGEAVLRCQLDRRLVIGDGKIVLALLEMHHAPADIGEGARWLEADRRVEGLDRLVVTPAYAERIPAQPDDQELSLAVEIAGLEGGAVEADRFVP